MNLTRPRRPPVGAARAQPPRLPDGRAAHRRQRLISFDLRLETLFPAYRDGLLSPTCSLSVCLRRSCCGPWACTAATGSMPTRTTCST